MNDKAYWLSVAATAILAASGVHGFARAVLAERPAVTAPSPIPLVTPSMERAANLFGVRSTPATFVQFASAHVFEEATLVGVAWRGDGERSSVIVEMRGAPVLARTGSALPDGSQVQEIGATFVVLSKPAGSRRLEMVGERLRSGDNPFRSASRLASLNRNDDSRYEYAARDESSERHAARLAGPSPLAATFEPPVARPVRRRQMAGNIDPRLQELRASTESRLRDSSHPD